MSIDFLRPILGDDLFAQVSEKLATESGINLVNVADGSYVPKTKFDAERTKKQDLETKITDLTAQLGESNQKLEAMDSLNQQITKLTQDVADRDGKIASLSDDYDIKDVIRAANARDVDLVFGLLDRSKITRKDGKIKGAEEQIKALQENKSFLFGVDEKPSSRGGFDGRQDILEAGEGAGSNSAVNNAIRQMAGRA